MARLGGRAAGIGGGRRRKGRLGVRVSSLPRARKGGGRRGKVGARVY